jgi:D-alanine-D-alanine ligase
LGGTSAERAVSLESGRAVARALRQSGHVVTAVDPAETDLATYPWQQVDVCFIALHGPAGEDGTVQRLLEDRQVPYTGSGPAASRLALSKSASKERFLQHGISTPPYVLVHESDTAGEIQQKAAGIGYPLVVKPDSQGSTLGVSIVAAPDHLARALTACFSLEAFGLIERRIVGREMTVAVLEREPLPILEIISPRELFDYQAKYHDDSVEHRFDLGLADEVLRDIERTAVASASALGTRGLCRVDLILDQHQRPWVLEVNTIPGFTDHSLAPKAAAKAGISFPNLCNRLVRQCVVPAAQQR